MLCRNLLIEQVAVLEQRLQEAEQLAFEEEARAAALELELFKSLDEEHERVMSEVVNYYCLYTVCLCLYINMMLICSL